MFKQSFDDVLEMCLDRLQRGETVENCLNDHPIFANELKGPLELANQFSSLPTQKPSLAADFFFQQHLEHIESTNNKIEKPQVWPSLNPFKQIGWFFFEFGFMALVIAVISFVFISHSDLLIHQPTTIPVVNKKLSYIDLSNLGYEGDLIGSITLQNGRYPLASNNYSGNPHEIQLDEQIAIGDLNNDGWEDAAALLYWRDAAVVPLWALAIVHNDQGEAKNISTIFIGPNLIVDQLKIENQKVFITVINGYGKRHTYIYQLDQSQLSLLSSEIIDHTSQQETITIKLLQELSYPIEGRSVSFKAGDFHGESFQTKVLDSSSHSVELTADGEQSPIVLLLTQSSSNVGSIYYLVIETEWGAEALPIRTAPIANVEGRPVTSSSMGHYLKLDSMQVNDEEITVKISTQGKNELQGEPAIETTYSFALIENALVPLSDN